MNKNMIVIHPNDEDTKYLNVLYDKDTPWNSLFLDETATKSKIKQVLTANALKNRDIMMLGKGSSNCLFAPEKVKGEVRSFARRIISPEHVQFLRGRTCIGVWNNANLFALQYGLKGLFSGRLITSLGEAMAHGITKYSQREIEIFNDDLAFALETCLETTKLNDVPRMLEMFTSAMNEIETINFGNFVYLE